MFLKLISKLITKRSWWADKCRTCKWYDEREKPTLAETGIFPGAGVCCVNPPEPLMTQNEKVESARPIVQGNDFCARHSLDADKEAEVSALQVEETGHINNTEKVNDERQDHFQTERQNNHWFKARRTGKR